MTFPEPNLQTCLSHHRLDPHLRVLAIHINTTLANTRMFLEELLDLRPRLLLELRPLVSALQFVHLLLAKDRFCTLLEPLAEATSVEFVSGDL